MILTKKQIKSFVSIMGQPHGSVLLNRFFNQYRKNLHSKDVAELYDIEYSKKILDHKVYTQIDNKYRINIFTKYSYEYLMQHKIVHKRILDIGCGSGDFAHALAFHGAKVVGIDFNDFFIEQANKIANENNLSCEFYCEDVNKKMFDYQFDYIVLNDITEHLSDYELGRLFETIKKLLNQNGEIVIHTPNGLALCNGTDNNFLQQLYIFYLKIFKKYQGFERTIEQIYYDQVHINIKSYNQLKIFLQKHGFKSKVIYDTPRFSMKYIDAIFSSNYLAICRKS